MAEEEMPDTIRTIAEDVYMLAANLRVGADLQEQRVADAELDRAARDWRVVELLVLLGDRIVAVTGVEGVRVPASVRDLAATRQDV